jgi:tyrosyl-tRNA synthetase
MGFQDSVNSSYEYIQSPASAEYEIDIARNLIERGSLELRSEFNPGESYNFLSSRSEIILPEAALKQRLSSDEPMMVKFGIDPTGSEVHLGHAVPIVMLNRLQRMGHQVVFIVGDMTAQIGDPSGRKGDRPMLTPEQIARNMESYTHQVAPLLRVESAEVHKNSDWFKKYDLGRLTMLLSNIRMAEVLQREDFRARMDTGVSPTLAEMIYPVAMGIDSVEVKADMELGGKDQLLNMQMCRKVMEIEGMDPEIVMTTGILEGTKQSHEKMSKSLANYIALNEHPESIFGKLMALPDTKMEMYFKALTDISNEEWILIKKQMESGNINPVLIKRTLALTVTGILHGEKAAISAHDNFLSKFSTKVLGDIDNVPDLSLDIGNSIIDTLATVTGSSKSELRRLADGGAIRLVNADGSERKLRKEELLQGGPIDYPLGNNFLRIGKKQIFKLV